MGQRGHDYDLGRRPLVVPAVHHGLHLQVGKLRRPQGYTYGVAGLGVQGISPVAVEVHLVHG